MVMVTVVHSCGMWKRQQEWQKEKTVDDSTENLTLYYANSTWTDLSPEVVTRDQLVTTENLIDTVMNALMDSGEMTDKQVRFLRALRTRDIHMTVRQLSILCSTLTGRPLTHMRWC